MSLRTFDDTDPAIEYMAETWQEAGGPDEYNGTTTFTATPGATAWVTFTGTGIRVFGTIASGQNPVSTYQIEGNPSTSSSYSGDISNEIQYGVLFYNVSGLDLSRHVLTIRNEANDELFLDYFTVTGPNSPISLPTIIRSASSSTPSLPSTSVTLVPGGESEETDPPLGPIIGGAVGGLALICVFVVGFLVYKKRKRRQHTESGNDRIPSHSAPPPITPFNLLEPQNAIPLTSPPASASPSKSGTAQPLSSASFFYSDKRPLGSMSSSSVPMSSQSNLAAMASSSAKEAKPPPYQR